MCSKSDQSHCFSITQRFLRAGLRSFSPIYQYLNAVQFWARVLLASSQLFLAGVRLSKPLQQPCQVFMTFLSNASSFQLTRFAFFIWQSPCALKTPSWPRGLTVTLALICHRWLEKRHSPAGSIIFRWPVPLLWHSASQKTSMCSLVGSSLRVTLSGWAAEACSLNFSRHLSGLCLASSLGKSVRLRSGLA